MSDFHAHVAQAGYGKLMVISDISLEVGQGEVLAVLGSNGSGKSTSLRALMGMIRCVGRQLSLNGEDVSHLPSWALPQRGLVYVPDGARCFPNLTVLENLSGAMAATGNGQSTEGFEKRLARVYAQYPVLKARSAQLAGTLSGGERQMLAIGRALMLRPRVLVLDEPSAGLSPKLTEELFESLAQIKLQRDCAVVVAEQNVPVAVKVADRCLVLEQGRVVMSGPMTNVARDGNLRQIYMGVRSN